MRKLKFTVAFLFAIALACVPAARAQNFTTVSAANIKDVGGNPLSSGLLCFTGTDASNNPISFQVGSGGQTLAIPFCTPIANGAVGTFEVPNPATTNPLIYYDVKVLPRPQRPGQAALLEYKLVMFSGSSFDFDLYAPPGGTVVAQVGSSITGPFTVNGNQTVTGTLTVGGSASFGGSITVSSCTGCNTVSLLLQTNGTNNTSQTTLNFQASSPLTWSNPSAGNELLGFASAGQNYILAGPCSGGAGAPSFRALCTADFSSAFAIKPASSDALLYVSVNGNDSNDGLSWGSAKLTLAGAKSACPSTGCAIYVGAGTFGFSSAVSFATAGQYFSLIGSGAGVTFLNYTPTTSTTAISIDAMPSTGNFSWAPAIQLRDFTLENNGICGTQGGCASLATAIGTGNTNFGAQRAEFSNLEITGFGNAFVNSNTNGSWGFTFRNVTFARNTALGSLGQAELIKFIDGGAFSNGSGWLNSGSQVSFVDWHCDSNTGGTLGVACYDETTPSSSTWTAVHAENQNCATQNCVHYINASGETTISGGDFLDDTAGGANRDYMITGGVLDVYGLSVSSASETFTHVAVVNTTGTQFWKNAASSVLTQTMFCPLNFQPNFICVVGGNSQSPYVYTPGLRTNLATKTSTYTLAANDSWINVTSATGTITVPHGLPGSRWHIHSPGLATGGTTTLACDSGTINGFSSVPLNAIQDAEVSADGTNCEAAISTGFPQLVAEINLTVQSVSIGNTTFYTATSAAGLYRADVDTMCTTAGSAGTVTASIVSNNGISTETQTTSSVSLAATGETPTGFTFYSAASQNVQYTTTVSGAAGSPQYALRIRLTYLGP